MLRVLEYGPDREAAFRPITAADIDKVVAAAESAPLLWIDATTPDLDELAKLAEVFQWHPLILEDLEQGDQRQKVEQFPGQIFGVLRLPRTEKGPACDLYVVQSEHVLVTVHTISAEWIDRRSGEVVARSDLAEHGAAAAVATILGAVGDTYEETIDVLEELVEKQEAGALDADGDPAPGLRRAAETRTIISEVRRSTGQFREVVGAFVRRELVNTVHSAELDLELRDVLDHAIRAHEDLDILHDRMNSLADTRLSMVAYRQNEITKVLSAWAAVLLVPTIITGWFGQNFDHMVGLHWRYGELFSLGLILGGMVAMYFTMRRAKWL
ncbi:MAG: magnesium transporter [Gaiellaceae bacterium]|nr:magnesium transporter [Gaiellaceae bacterium]